MSRGIKFPLTVTPSGKAELSEGSEMTRQIVILGVKPASSRHPWNQRLTPREDLIYDVADHMVGGELVAYIYDFFDDLKKLEIAYLPRSSNSVKVKIPENTGDVEVSITYVDLEDNESRDITFGGK